ncbi:MULTISPECIES: hypothetical protein [unclassified Mesorhizobium]|nr:MULTISPECIES: hypothetical protein [unclassified Mesorhizobium]MBZ9683857.1 hypothetical protein [Mesorhizobium sp. CO1-1-2]MBZ9696593.1 hypothetical protein [Mesorhizobium sp. CO1-1-9]MBZ9725416.1 hypothetical protein [Mesorhizobium sp. CO1-1-11]MBZ9923649.1 hypothetical protein [Mesorhizobium sp. BR1-1-4]
MLGQVADLAAQLGNLIGCAVGDLDDAVADLSLFLGFNTMGDASKV